MTQSTAPESLSAETIEKLGYNPHLLKRELKKYYISATEKEIEQMLETIGAEKLDDLFSHLDQDILFEETPDIGISLEYQELITHMEKLALKNKCRSCFIGDGLKWGKVHPIATHVSNIRGLTTAYTPYQPERSQGTLHSLWLYSNALSQLTGFEAINTSLYERSTALYEALNTALRIKRKSKKVLVAQSLYPTDWEVLKTLSLEVDIEIEQVSITSNGLIDEEDLKEKLINGASACAFNHVNSFGLVEDVDSITDLIREHDALSIGIIDPAIIVKGGLKAPISWGKHGCDMIVGEAQHLAIGPNFGGPGLGLFGIRYNSENKNQIRSTAGRFVGKGLDENGDDALLMVLSTREQHIRREKATSNICSNQSFLATIVGASLFAKGDIDLEAEATLSHERSIDFAHFISEQTSIELLYPNSPFFNEVAIKLKQKSEDIIEMARQNNLHIGANISERTGVQSLLIYFNAAQTEDDFNLLKIFFRDHFPKKSDSEHVSVAELPESFKRSSSAGLKKFDEDVLKDFYNKLGQMNVSPDDNIYPLGSCTMKYNPYINDYAANLPGFTQLHPQAPIEDAQGSLEILYQTQEIFKSITGLPAVTTQPVAGAQGELVGIKMFQAYHRDNGNQDKKDIVLIPASAHGTNPATATMAGYLSKGRADNQTGIVTIAANERGQIDFDNLKEVVSTFGERISCIMITNPNTSGIFETRFKEIAKLMHSVDALVYMDGANMNAIASWVDLNKMGVDAVHNNLHKTWTIPHGGGGPGDAIVAVSDKIKDYLPGVQIYKNSQGSYYPAKTPKSIGEFHRHWGNFAHKVRAYTYLRALGSEGVKQMSGVATLSACYLYEKLKALYPTLPSKAQDEKRMHEFIITISKECFSKIEACGIAKSQCIGKIGKLFLDFGMHAPTVSFPEPFGLMVEPTESFSKEELDDFINILKTIHYIIHEKPELLKNAPHFTPVAKVDEVRANKELILSEQINDLPILQQNKIEPGDLMKMDHESLVSKIEAAEQERV